MDPSPGIPQKNIVLNTSQQEDLYMNLDKVKEYAIQALAIKDEDKLIWSLIKVFPEISLTMKIVILVLNLIYGGINNKGIGTMLMSFLYKNSCNKTQFAIGLLQFLMNAIWIGWIWALVWSILLLLYMPTPSANTSNLNSQNPFAAQT